MTINQEQNKIVPINFDSDSVQVYYFFGEGCGYCKNIAPFLQAMEEKYPIQLNQYDIYEDRELLTLFTEYNNRFDISVEERAIPTIFISNQYFIGETAIRSNFEEAITNTLKETTNSRNLVNEQNADDTEYNTLSSTVVSVGSISLFAITISALVDAISPCSIAILVFLIGARVLVSGFRKRALKVGLAFCLSIFIGYFLFGIGLFNVIQISGFSGIFSLAVGIVALAAGLLYLKDVFWYRRGGFAMEVPLSLKPALMKMQKSVTNPFGAFLIGFIVVLVELPCTGGPYLYTLGQLANSTTRLQAVPLLLYYSFIFVLPVVLISLALHSNLLSLAKVRDWNEKNKRGLRLVGGVMMMGLGFYAIPLPQLLNSIQIFLNIFKVVGIPLLITLTVYSVVPFVRRNEVVGKLWHFFVFGILVVSLILSQTFVGLVNIETASADIDVEKKCQQLETLTRGHDLKCIYSCSLEEKTERLDILYRIQADMDNLGCENVRIIDDLCGGIKNTELTYFEVIPSSSNINLDESIQLSVSFDAPQCLIETKQIPNSYHGRGTHADAPKYWIDLPIGTFIWTSLDPSIATVTQSGLVTGKSQGTATIIVTSDSGYFPDSLRGEAIVTVEDEPSEEKVDVVFVISTNMDQWCMFPDDGCPDNVARFPEYSHIFFQKMEEEFSDFQAGVISFASHFCVDPDFCGIPSGSCYASATHGVGITSEVELNNALSQMGIVCSNDGGENEYYGTSMYSGLMTAINEYPWREGAERAIIVLGARPAGLHYNWPTTYYNTGVEPVSGISREDVIQTAISKEINIYALNTRAFAECNFDSLLIQLVREELMALASGTSGKYYPSSSFFPSCFPAAHESILLAIEFIAK